MTGARHENWLRPNRGCLAGIMKERFNLLFVINITIANLSQTRPFSDIFLAIETHFWIITFFELLRNNIPSGDHLDGKRQKRTTIH